VPLFGALKPGALLEQDHLRALDAKADTHLILDGWRYASIAKRTEAPIHVCSLDLRQSHVADFLLLSV